jgi:hypothetical protein
MSEENTYQHNKDEDNLNIQKKPKPPASIISKELWKSRRIDELILVIARYIEAPDVQPLTEWYEELYNLQHEYEGEF